MQSFIEISWNKNIRPGVPSFFSPNFFNHLMISNYSFFNLSQSTYVTLAKCLIPKQKLLITILKIGDPKKKNPKINIKKLKLFTLLRFNTQKIIFFASPNVSSNFRYVSINVKLSVLGRYSTTKVLIKDLKFYIFVIINYCTYDPALVFKSSHPKWDINEKVVTWINLLKWNVKTLIFWLFHSSNLEDWELFNQTKVLNAVCGS